MTKKYLIAIAAQMACVRPPSHDHACYDTWHECVLAVARVAMGNNPNFNQALFIAACRGEKA